MNAVYASQGVHGLFSEIEISFYEILDTKVSPPQSSEMEWKVLVTS
jgi:hypothetical protein